MMQEIPQQVSEVLDVLADRFGTTAAHLWEVLVRQAYVEAVTMLLIIGALWFASVVSIFVASRLTKSPTWIDEDLAVPGAIAFSVSAAFLVAGAAIFLAEISSIVTGFVNPEYFALQEILKAVGG